MSNVLCPTRCHDSVNDPGQEPVLANRRPEARYACGSREAYLFAATCPALRDWSADLCVQVVAIGVSDDPLARVARMRAEKVAGRCCFLEPFEPEYEDGDWHIRPLIADPTAALPDGCSAWGGTFRVTLPPGASTADLRRRVAMLLRPLDALHCAALPDAVERRFAAGKLLPALPRYSVRAGRAELAQDLYRLQDAGDVAFVVAALGGALKMLGVGRRVFDRMVQQCWQTPTTNAPQCGVETEAGVGR